MLFWVWRVRTAGCLHDVCVIVTGRAKPPNHWNPSCCMQRHTVTTQSPCMLLSASVKCSDYSSGLWPYDLCFPPHPSVLMHSPHLPSPIISPCPRPARHRRAEFMRISSMRRDFTCVCFSEAAQFPPAVPTCPVPSVKPGVKLRSREMISLRAWGEGGGGIASSKNPRLPVSLHSCNCCAASALPLLALPRRRSRARVSSSHQAVPGGAAQCHRAQRCGATGYLHSQRGKRRNLCLQSHWRQHRPPGGIRVWRPITGGMKDALCVRKGSPSSSMKRTRCQTSFREKYSIGTPLMFKVPDLMYDFSKGLDILPSAECGRPPWLPLSRFPGL